MWVSRFAQWRHWQQMRPAKKSTKGNLMNTRTAIQSLKTLAISLALSVAVSASALAALDMTSAQQQQIEGSVGNFLEPGLFWLNTNEGKVLVYSNGEATKNLRSGQRIRVTGFAPLDWSKLAELEINARKFEAAK
jgi:predicted RNA-binding protein (virulence factor B family)